MALLHHNKGIEKLLEEIPRKGPAGYKKLKPLLKRICEALVMKLHVDGLPAQEIAKGFSLGKPDGPREVKMLICTGTESGVGTTVIYPGSTTTVTLSSGRQCSFAAIIGECYGPTNVIILRGGVVQSDIFGGGIGITTGPAVYSIVVGDISISFTLAWSS